jgi:hypothetical protein
VLGQFREPRNYELHSRCRDKVDYDYLFENVRTILTPAVGATDDTATGRKECHLLACLLARVRGLQLLEHYSQLHDP